MPKDIRERYHVKCSCERKIIMPGILPKSFDLVENSWMPAKRDAKKNSSALRWVTMYPPRRFKDKEQSTFNTEIAFFIETYSYDPKTDEERGCKVENIPKVLRKASELMADELRKLVSSDDGDTMVAAKMLDDISMRFSEALEKTLFDR